MGELIGVVAGIIGIIGGLYAFARWVNANRRRIEAQVEFGAGRPPKQLKSKKLVAVAHYPPLSFVYSDSTSGELVAKGPVPELLRRIAERNHLALEIRQVRWDRLKAHLEMDGCDMVAPIFPSASRSEYSTVVGITHSVPLGAVTKTSASLVSSPADLGMVGVRIAVTSGEVGDEYVKANFPTKYESAQMYIGQTSDITSPMHTVLSGDADIAVADALSCIRFIRENDPGLTRLRNPFETCPPDTFRSGLMVPSQDRSLAKWLEEEVARERVSEDFLKLEAEQLQGWSQYVHRLGIPEGVRAPRVQER